MASELCVQAVSDSTGRQDLVKALREAVLLSAAGRNGVTKLARGDSASRLAARAIAMSAKGEGFSLPASMHYLDARYSSNSNCDPLQGGSAPRGICNAPSLHSCL